MSALIDTIALSLTPLPAGGGDLVTEQLRSGESPAAILSTRCQHALVRLRA